MKHYILSALLLLALLWSACSKKASAPGPLDTSPTGLLARYDMGVNSYDVLPVTTFVLSYNSGNQVTDVFEKSGQTLIYFSCTYTGTQLTQTTDNNLGVQHYSYDSQGRIAEIDFTTPVDTGKRVFTYDASTGKLSVVTDSVTNPPSFPVRTQYAYIYDNTGANVIQVNQSTLDLSGNPTLRQQSFYTFDGQPNCFHGLPPLMDMRQLPGDLPALVNKNNVVSIHQVGTIPEASSGNVPILDTIGTYSSQRTYQYNSKGLPVSCQEAFQDLQYNYSGTRSFTYDY